MKIKNLLMCAVAALIGLSAQAQVNFDDPKFAKWGADAADREANMLANQFMKEAYQNKDFNRASGYLKQLLDKAPEAAESIYQRGEQIFQQKFNRATTKAAQNAALDSMMIIFDLRAANFGKTPKAKAEILERKAKQYAIYRKNDNAGIRKVMTDAIEAAREAETDNIYELVILYFSKVVEAYQNDDEEVYPEVVIAEYDRLSAVFDNVPADKSEFRDQFETLLGTSGVATCDTLLPLMEKKVAANPDNVDVLGQAVTLLGRAQCKGDFFIDVTERYYKAKPDGNTACFLAQAFQDKGEFAKATGYLREALAVEQDQTAKEKLLMQLAIVELAQKKVSAAVEVANQLRELNPESPFAYFIIAQSYASGGCASAYWAAYDEMKKAEAGFEDPALKRQATDLCNAYRQGWPRANDEQFFMEGIKQGDSFTVDCGPARGKVVTVRFR